MILPPPHGWVSLCLSWGWGQLNSSSQISFSLNWCSRLTEHRDFLAEIFLPHKISPGGGKGLCFLPHGLQYHPCILILARPLQCSLNSWLDLTAESMSMLFETFFFFFSVRIRSWAKMPDNQAVGFDHHDLLFSNYTAITTWPQNKELPWELVKARTLLRETMTAS